MAYSDFKNIDSIKNKFNIPITSSHALFSTTAEINPGYLLTEMLKDNIQLALNINTEKARSELIICPVLVEVRRLLNKQISLFSGIEFNVDDSLGLTGYCDFILSNSPDQIFLEFPVVCVVEAKNENIRTGYAQCIAEMIAAKIYNENKSNDKQDILGVITTGSNWKFLQYTEGRILIDFDEYMISSINKILGIFIETMNKNHAV
ncbi:hypothetical protein TI04_08775 [Achromatium sp. WMS2]|nr:hypothetical protein TI04_08775 [Achromatium sp. WMS2]